MELDGTPDRIGPYRVLELLGEGGMGTVYLAEQREPVRRRVAVKVIKPGMDTRQVLSRFEAERQALAIMEHDAIARVFEAGTTDEGRPYFAMEYVRGVPLNQYCDDKKLSIAARIALLQQVCAGVQHAHTKGVLHRDLKPGNILVTEQEGRPQVKIIDFGLARATDHRLTEATLFTEHGQILGTLEYMSPEQAGRGGLDIDSRTDVYSLGVILYELLVGVLPFSGQQLRQAGLLEMQRVIREVDPPKPTTRLQQHREQSAIAARARDLDLGALQRRLRGDLDWITMRALEKDRDRRYGTPAELAQDLQRHLDCEPVLAGPPTLRYRAGKFARRYRLQVIAAALLLFSLVAGVIGTTIFAVQSARRQAELEARAYAVHLQAVQQRIDSGRVWDVAAALADTPAEPVTGITDAAARTDPAFHWLAQRATLPQVERLRPSPGVTIPKDVAPDPSQLPGRILDLELLPEHSLLAYQTQVADDAGALLGVAVICRLDARGGLEDRLVIGRTVHDLALDPGGQFVLAANADGPPEGSAIDEISKHSLRDGDRIHGVATPGWDQAVVALSPAGDRVAYGGFSFLPHDRTEGVLFLTDAQLNDPVVVESTDPQGSVPAGVSSIDFAPDGQRFAVGHTDGTVTIRDAGDGEVLHRLAYSERGTRVFTVRFGPLGRHVVACGDDGRVALFDATTGALAHELAPHRQAANDAWISSGACFSSDGQWVLTGGNDLLVRAHSVLTGQVVGAWRFPIGVTCLVLDDRGHRVLAAGTTPDRPGGFALGGLFSMQLGDLPLPLEFLCDGADHVDAAVAADSRTAWSLTAPTGGLSALHRWDLATGEHLLEVTLYGSFAGRALALAPDDDRVTVVGERGRGYVVDATNGALIAALQPPAAVMEHRPPYLRRGFVEACFHPDGHLVAVGVGNWAQPRDPDRAAPILLFDAETGQCVQTFEGLRETVGRILFSPDGSRLAATDYRGQLRIYELDGKSQPITEQASHPAALAFTADGARLYWCREGGKLASIDPRSGGDLEVYPHAHDYLRDVAIAPGGDRMLVTTTLDASLWDMPPRNRLATLARPHRQLGGAWPSYDEDGSLRTILVGERHLELRAIDVAARPELHQLRRVVRGASLARTEPELRAALDLADSLPPGLEGRLAARLYNDQAWRAVALAGADARTCDEAVRRARNAIDAATPGAAFEAMARDTLGVALLRLEEHEQAARQLQLAAEGFARHRYADPDIGNTTHAFLAIALAALGREQPALEQLERARALWCVNDDGVLDSYALGRLREACGALGAPMPEQSPMSGAVEHLIGPPDLKLWSTGPGAGPRIEIQYARPQRVAMVRVFEAYGGVVREVTAVEPGGRRHPLFEGVDPTAASAVFEVGCDVRQPIASIELVVWPTSRGAMRIDTVQITGPDSSQWPTAARVLR